jgi:hypothetical protein
MTSKLTAYFCEGQPAAKTVIIDYWKSMSTPTLFISCAMLSFDDSHAPLFTNEQLYSGATLVWTLGTAFLLQFNISGHGAAAMKDLTVSGFGRQA